MDRKQSQTRNSILAAAGPLFSEYGFDGVSTRTLSEVANVNVAAINYYFGGKEELFQEVVRIAAEDCRADLPDDFETLVHDTDDRKILLKMLEQVIDLKVRAYLDIMEPGERWKRRLMLRIFLQEGDILTKVVENFRPEHEAQVLLFMKLNSALTALQAQLAVFSMIGQLAFYVFARSPVLAMLDKDDFDETVVTELKGTIHRNLQDLLKLG